MTVIEATKLSKSYGDGPDKVEVLADVDLKVKKGEFVSIVGFSGSGKTTLISLLAGLVESDSGGVLFLGKELTEPSQDIGVVFQSYSLMPWLSVEGNIALAVNTVCADKTRAERSAQVNHYIDMVGLTHARDRKPSELSGGMRQRVALARALAAKPDVLLLDEPLSALDALTRARLQDELAAICEQEHCTIVLITNDVDEAILLADRVIPMTPAPKAYLSEEFIVDYARPRDRTKINSDANFIALRASIIKTLMSMNESASSDFDKQWNVPNVIPITQSNKLPKAVAEAAASNLEKRYLEFSQTEKVYPTPDGPLTVVEDFNLKLKKGEFVTLIGHSGCGKSTVLSMTAGLTDISSGAVVLDGTHVTTTGPDRAVVFQSPSLMPWLTAFDNVALGVNKVYPHASKSERHDVIAYYLSKVGLADSMHRKASDLSNGMRQRVGIARAFALSPKLLLLDEPFGMLDSVTRWELQDVLMEVWERTKVTTICVTHDVDEAILLGDRVVMMSNGPRAKVGNIMEVALERPRSRDALLSHPDYYAYREELMNFLEAYEGGANPDKALLEEIANNRKHKLSVNANAKSASEHATVDAVVGE
ncbi:MAG: ABC transporter ATP-binding protein [Gammaproteobacteria bacterium]|nr:ABC transporter ATP-binding protein [Gammaproteobacteria bacterium]